jgi:hypothetical protein
VIPGHVLHETIKEVSGVRRILRSRYLGADAVTRILLEFRERPSRDALVKGIVLHGSGSTAGIHKDLVPTLEGYRVAARLSHPDPRWPTALAAGVLPDGFVYVTTRWIPGTPLHRLPDEVDGAARRDIAVQAAELLVALHARKIAFGDLKAANLVLGMESRVSLIDLDTLREVPDAQTAAVTTDATPEWAAPEQVERHETYLASDVWAWANLLSALFPHGTPPEWRHAVAACRLRDPLARPRSDALSAHLRDGTVPLYDALSRRIDLDAIDVAYAPASRGGVTERVPEHTPAGATERVPEHAPAAGSTRSGAEPSAAHPDGTSTGEDPSARFSSGRRRPALGGVAVGVTVLAVVVGIPLAVWDHGRVQEADRLAAATLEALQEHKTDHRQNSRARRDDLRAQAEEAYAVRSTPASAAIRALAVVWEAGWQDSRKTFDAATWEIGRAAVEDASDSGRVEALLAEATLYTADCRLNASASSAASSCARARSALAAFKGGDAPDWLRVEAAWTEVLLLTDLAARQTAANDPTASTTRHAALRTCDDAAAWRPQAPVHGPELLQDCLLVASAAQDVDRYLSYGAELIAADAERGLQKRTLRHVYGAWQGCAEVHVTKRANGDWSTRGSDWCQALGDTTRDCDARARDHLAQGQRLEPDRPWSQLTRHIDPMNSRCVR